MPTNPIHSRIQIFIVLAVVGLVVGIAVSAIQKMRDAAAMMQCNNNLKQLGLGFQNYDSAQGRIPPLTDFGFQARTGRGIRSVFFDMVPYLECTPTLYHNDDRTHLYHGHSSVEIILKDKTPQPLVYHGGFANNPWKLFVDPADTTANKLFDIPMTLPDGSTGYYTTGSYAANGLLPWHRANVKHLGSNTIVFAERPQVCKTSAGETVYNLWGVGFYSPHMPAFAALASLESPESWTTGQVSPAWPLPVEGNAEEIRVRIGREDAVPQPQDFRHPIQRVGEPCDPRLPGSMHFGGMNCLMSDGSVRMFSYRTSPWVFWSACVPAVAE
jgi:hypothetical protein